MTNNNGTQTGFHGLGIATNLLGILEYHKYITPTPIQVQAIPAAIEGNDLIGIAQTGTGKTLAFGVPMIQRLAKSKGQGLVLVPTRELALQVDETLKKIGSGIGLRTAVVIGGMSMHKQTRELQARPHIIVATPGRLVDHIQQKTVSLVTIGVVVLDEADRMLDIGFAPQINQILSNVPRERQTMLFSATMPTAIAALANKHMKTPLRIEVAPAGTSSAQVSQEIFVVKKEQKISLLHKVLADNEGTVIVFMRTKFSAKRVAQAIRNMGHTAVEIHSNRSLSQRKAALDGFKSGAYRVLVATDIAARGIDVTGIALVVNYDLPDNPEDYVHRIGRTGRAGRSGKAVSFATPDQKSDIKSIERVIRKTLPISSLPANLPEAPVSAQSNVRHERPFRGHRPNGRQGSRGQRSGGRRRHVSGQRTRNHPA